jgi:hypothetical protein
LSFWRFLIILCEVSQVRKWGMWILKVFCFLILKFRNIQFSSCFLFYFLFFYFFNFLCEVSQGERYLLLFWKLGRYFVLVFRSSELFNFLPIILGLQIFCVKFSHGRKWGMCLSSCEFWKFSVFIFWICILKF